MTTLDSILADDLTPSLAWCARMLARIIRPPEKLNVAEWTEKRRRISEDSTSPFPGDWDHTRTPHLVEPMEVLSPDHPATDIWVKKSAQTGFTEAAINVVGHAIDMAPTKILYVLPTIDEALKFNRMKLEPTIRATASLRRRVVNDAVKGRAGSTATFKRFPGGYMVVANAHSSSSLQMISAQILLCDEVTEYPDEAGGRGDPLKQAVARTLAFTKKQPKRFFFATPGVKGSCRIDDGYQASDQRQIYCACPQCGAYQVLSFDRMRWASDRAPHGAYFECKASGCVIEQRHLDRMMNDRGGRLWIKTYADEDDPEGNPAPPDCINPADFNRWRARPSKGRNPGFHMWQAQSLLADWESIVSSLIDAGSDSNKLRVFVQQVRGETYEERGDAPDCEKLLLAKPDRSLGEIPPGYVVLTGAVDVQGDRLEWAVYAWGEGMASALIDYGVLPGSTDHSEVWTNLDGVRGKSWRDSSGRRWSADLWLIDAGYRSQTVYNYCRSRGGINAKLAPIMGDSNATGPRAQVAPLVSKPRPVAYQWNGQQVQGGAMRYDLGTWPLKTLLHDGLRLALAGPDDVGRTRPGSILFARECDLEFFEQITAESLIETTDKKGRTKRGWQKRRPANEQTDLWCYSRAGAEVLELSGLTADDWADLARARGAPQAELFGPAADLAVERREARRDSGVEDMAPSDAATRPAEGWISPQSNWL